MLIEEPRLRHWMDHFYGYGSWQARIWFVAYEEGGGDLPEEVAERLDYFLQRYQSEKKPILCDVRDLYRNVRFRDNGPRAQLYTNLYEYRFGDNAIQHGVWKNLIAFRRGYDNEQIPDLLEYQKISFASPSAYNEALIRLYPLPSPHNHAWYYSWLDMPQLPFLKSREQYQEQTYQHRISDILNNIREYKPKVVLMYGMNNINALKASVQAFFSGAEFKLFKATKQVMPQHHRADINGTTLLLTTQIPALRHNRVETGFDWEELGKSVKGYSQ